MEARLQQASNRLAVRAHDDRLQGLASIRPVQAPVLRRLPEQEAEDIGRKPDRRPPLSTLDEGALERISQAATDCAEAVDSADVLADSSNARP